MDNRKLAERCGAIIGDVTIQGHNDFKIIFSEHSFKYFCEELRRWEHNDIVHELNRVAIYEKRSDLRSN